MYMPCYRDLTPTLKISQLPPETFAYQLQNCAKRETIFLATLRINYLNNEIYSTNFDHKHILQQDQLTEKLRYLRPKIWNILYHLTLETLETLKNLQGKSNAGLIVLVGCVLITSITLGMSINHVLEPAIQRCSGNYKEYLFWQGILQWLFCIKMLFMTVFFMCFLITCF